ncbi:hypothetical protein ARMGADRAFT_946059, partial [Armillaria gallica]
GQRVLETLFVRLSNPPRDVKFKELPMNIVPLTRTPSAILCSLPADSSISINQSQIEIIPNFTMTNYCLQGKTHHMNPVDLMNCRSHQSYCTALSHSATAEGTLLLPNFMDPCQPAFNPRKIQGGCSGHLQQEFRELELLDHITLLLYNSMLPCMVVGERRCDLLMRFQSNVGHSFVPPGIEHAIAWSPYNPVCPVNCSEFEWDIKCMPHLPSGILHREDENIQKMPSIVEMLTKSFPEPAVSASRPISPIMFVPSGCAWYNNSCPYDLVIFVLANMWKSNPIRFAEHFNDINQEWLGELLQSLTLHMEGKYLLEQVRDFMRHKLHREYPNMFVWGKETSPGAITEKWFNCSTPFMTVRNKCINGHIMRPVHYYLCSITSLSLSKSLPHMIDQYLTLTQYYPSRMVCSECEGATRKMECYHTCPTMIPVYTEGTNIDPKQTFTLQLEDNSAMYCLSGVIYYGTSHFTARYVDETGNMWFNDGYVQGRTAINKGEINQVDMTSSTDGRKPIMAFYKQV